MTSDSDLPRQGPAEEPPPTPRPARVDELAGFQIDTDALARMVRAMNEAGGGVVASLAKLAQALPEAIIRTIGAAAAEIGQRLQDAFPPNWQELEDHEFEQVFDMVREGTICVVWVPEVEVVRELIQAADGVGREQVLIERRDRVLASVRAILEESGPDRVALQGELRGLVSEALAAADAGLDLAAQTLLAVALSRLLHDGLGFEGLGRAFKEWRDEDPENAVLVDLRATCLQRATVNALMNTEDAPGGFNRHGTLHGDPVFLTEPAMLGGFLLVGAWVCELAWLAEHAAEMPPGA